MLLAMLLLSVAALHVSFMAFEDADGMRHGHRGFSEEPKCQPWIIYEHKGGSVMHEYIHERQLLLYVALTTVWDPLP